MVAIVAGNGLGLLDTSLNTIGTGILGEGMLGQGSSRIVVNVVNGNLVLQAQDARLAGRGSDLVALRTHNSLGAPSDGDGWRWGYEQTVQFQGPGTRSEEHTSELQSLMRISYAVFCLNKKTKSEQKKLKLI